MPCDYSKSKIYVLKSNESDEVYVGSTTRSLASRMAEHRADYKNVSNGKKLYKKNTAMKVTKYPSVYIELVETYPCRSREELHRREAEIISNTKCVNRINPLTNQCRFCGGVAEVVAGPVAEVVVGT
jgi:hypothetical protein